MNCLPGIVEEGKKSLFYISLYLPKFLFVRLALLFFVFFSFCFPPLPSFFLSFKKYLFSSYHVLGTGDPKLE